MFSLDQFPEEQLRTKLIKTTSVGFMYSLKNTKNYEKEKDMELRKVRELCHISINLNNEENDFRSTLSVGSNVTYRYQLS